MVDIHCHVLPGVDDGARDWAEAELMCQMAIKDGIKAIVCTPHANDIYVYDRSRNTELLTELQQRVGDKLELRLGCDFHLSFDNIESALEDSNRLAIFGTDYLLVEFRDFAIPPAVLDSLSKFLSVGVTPIITHPERNMLLRPRPEKVLSLAKMGCAIQVTAGAFTGRWGEGSKPVCEWLIDRGAVHIVASDAHNTTSRAPILSSARDIVAQLYGPERASALFVDNPQAVLHNQPLAYQPDVRA